MTIITDSALTASPTIGEDLRYPVLCWENLVETGNLVATSEIVGYPASNLANPSTNLIWRASLTTESSPTADQYLTVTTSADFDYLAIARHNFGTLGLLVSVEVAITGSPEWNEVIAPQVLPDDAPVIFRFLPQNTGSATATAVRFLIQPTGYTTSPEAAVLFVGKSLVFER